MLGTQVHHQHLAVKQWR